MHDLIIRGARLIDPGQNIDDRRDVAFAGGKVAAVAPALADPATETIDAAGLILTPGLIDIHVHIYAGVSHYGIDPDPHCLAKGVTTAVDAGSSGASTFPGLRRYIIDVSATRLFAYLNISRIGMVTGSETDPPLGELEDMRNVHVPSAVRCTEANRDVILGIKVRLSDNLAAGGVNEMPSLKLAREASAATGLPIMVHTPRSTLGLPAILKELRAGDVVTHCFHFRESGILHPSGDLLPEVREAVERGILFDVGHGFGSFSYDVARTALKQGFLPHTISSDLHHYNINGPVFDLATTVSKFLHLGLSLPDALRKVTCTPAEVIKMGKELGTLAVGACGDAALFRLVEGSKPVADSAGKVETLRQWLEPVRVVRNGRLVHTHGAK